MPPISKTSNETLEALLWHFTRYSVGLVTSVPKRRLEGLTATKNDELILPYLDDTRLRRKRLGWSEYMDIIALQQRGMNAREIQKTLQFSWYLYDMSLEEIVRKLSTGQEVVAIKETMYG